MDTESQLKALLEHANTQSLVQLKLIEYMDADLERSRALIEQQQARIEELEAELEG